MKKTIIVVGNEMDSYDSLGPRISTHIQPLLPEYQFIHWDPTEELPEHIQKDILLIDVVKGITAIQIFTDLESFTVSPRTTVHDFDIPVSLGLLKKLHKIDTVTIIGLPDVQDESKTEEQLLSILQSILC